MTIPKTRVLIGIAAAMITATAVTTTQAQTYPGQYRMPAGQPAQMYQARQLPPAVEATQALRDEVAELTAFLRQEPKPNKLQVAAFLDREIAPAFDFDYMARWILGPSSAHMSEEKRAELAAHIESDFLTGLTQKLAGFSDQKVRFLRPRPGPRGTVEVRIGIMRPGAYPSQLSFKMYRSEDGWKVYDVAAGGRSVVAYYRQKLAREAMQRMQTPARPMMR